MPLDRLVELLHHFLLTLMRTSSLMIFWPLWDHRATPRPVKVFSMLVVALVLTPVAAPHLPAFPADWPALLSLALREFLLGLGIGLILRVIFAGVHMAGNLAAVYMGFGMVTLYDPQTQGQGTVVADLMVLVALMLFLSLEIHHALFRLLAQSFVDLPMGGLPRLPLQALQFLVGLGALAFKLAVQCLAPVIAVLFVTQVTLGYMARAVPQIQVMILSFPLTIALGLLFISFTLIFTGGLLQEQFGALKRPLTTFMRAWQG
ncbi:MAG: flagellar biosynthetic protein FliR [Deltaproteobacteria bacterium]|nr:flagellar biosynthetic protein FliR [Deltaproteobacteria bacterium]